MEVDKNLPASEFFKFGKTKFWERQLFSIGIKISRRQTSLACFINKSKNFFIFSQNRNSGTLGQNNLKMFLYFLRAEIFAYFLKRKSYSFRVKFWHTLWKIFYIHSKTEILAHFIKKSKFFLYLPKTGISKKFLIFTQNKSLKYFYIYKNRTFKE